MEPRNLRPSPFTRIPVSLLAIVAIFASLACARPEPPPVSSGPPIAGLVEVDTGGRGLLFVRPDHQLGRYDDLLIEHIGFRYSEEQEWLSPREERRISRMLENTVRGSQSSDIGLASDEGPCVVAVRFTLKDLEIYDPDYANGSMTGFVSSFGEATMIMELIDSTTGDPLAVFVQKRDLGGGSASGGSSDSLQRLGKVVDLAMRDMGRQLQELTPPTRGGLDGECRGNLARVGLGAH